MSGHKASTLEGAFHNSSGSQSSRPVSDSQGEEPFGDIIPDSMVVALGLQYLLAGVTLVWETLHGFLLEGTCLSMLKVSAPASHSLRSLVQ